MRVDFCDGCGAPLHARWDKLVIRCQYCQAHNQPAGPTPLRLPVDGRPRLSVAGRTYVLERCIGHGEACEVYRGRWVVRLGELVVVKVLRSLADEDLVRREHAQLQYLCARRSQGAEHFTSLLPAPIAMAPIRTEHGERLVSIYQWRPGFVHDLESVGRVYPQGVPPAVATWVLKRLLELLGWLHSVQRVHGAVLPQHVLIHPRDHGATLAGWSHAVKPGQPLPARVKVWKKLYPSEVWSGGPATPATDIAMAARVASSMTYGGLPGALGTLVDLAAQGERPQAWSLLEEITAAARQELGPPRYHPLPMPGWNIHTPPPQEN